MSNTDTQQSKDEVHEKESEDLPLQLSAKTIPHAIPVNGALPAIYPPPPPTGDFTPLAQGNKAARTVLLQHSVTKTAVTFKSGHDQFFALEGCQNLVDCRTIIHSPLSRVGLEAGTSCFTKYRRKACIPFVQRFPPRLYRPEGTFLEPAERASGVHLWRRPFPLQDQILHTRTTDPPLMPSMDLNREVRSVICPYGKTVLSARQ